MIPVFVSFLPSTMSELNTAVEPMLLREILADGPKVGTVVSVKDLPDAGAVDHAAVLVVVDGTEYADTVIFPEKAEAGSKWTFTKAEGEGDQFPTAAKVEEVAVEEETPAEAPVAAPEAPAA